MWHETNEVWGAVEPGIDWTKTGRASCQVSGSGTGRELTCRSPSSPCLGLGTLYAFEPLPGRWQRRRLVGSPSSPCHGDSACVRHACILHFQRSGTGGSMARHVLGWVVETRPSRGDGAPQSRHISLRSETMPYSTKEPFFVRLSSPGTPGEVRVEGVM